MYFGPNWVGVPPLHPFIGPILEWFCNFILNSEKDSPNSELFKAGVHKFSKKVGAISTRGGRSMTLKKLHMENPQILGGTVQNLVALVTWRSRFVHVWCKGKCVWC